MRAIPTVFRRLVIDKLAILQMEIKRKRKRIQSNSIYDLFLGNKKMIQKVIIIYWLFSLTMSVGEILNLPILIPFSNDGPRHGIGCKAASEIAIDAFRNLTTTLNKNYQIQPIFLDERGAVARR